MERGRSIHEHMAAVAEKLNFSWAPQPGPQKALIDCPYPEILFGGARGGGKTDGILGKYAIKEKRWGIGFNAVFFRKEMPQQDDLIERAKEIYCPTGAIYIEHKKQFSMPHGGRIRFRPLESILDAEKYQGQSLSDAAVEEAGNYPQPDPIDRLFGCLRSSHGVPIQLILTANPGGAGHQWIKSRYIDPSPMGFQRLVRKLPSGREHHAVYIPSRVTDNRILLAQDPGYVDRLYLVGGEALVRAWLTGDWNVIAGAFFPEFGPRHIIEPVELPTHWTRFRAMDWGSAKPFSAGWYAVSDGELLQFPRGALIKYREWYGVKYKPNGELEPNVGVKLTATEVGHGIVERQPKGEAISYSVLDPSAFAEDGGPSIAEMLSRAGAVFRAADNKRVTQRGAMGGWDQVRGRLKGVDAKPMLYFFSTCTHTIRTLPALQHDVTKPEDVDTDAEDHAGDETRYACMSRPWTQMSPKEPGPPRGARTIEEMVRRHEERQEEYRRI
jgi:hypothetical protein